MGHRSIPFCFMVLGQRRFQTLSRGLMEKVKWKNFNKPILTENYLELMENRLSSSGLFSQDLRHWKSSKRPTKTCKNKTLNLIFLKTESSSCWCSMILVGREEEIQKNVFQHFEQVMNYAKRFPQEHWTFRGPGSEKKHVTLLKENGKPQPTWWWNDSRNLDIQYSKVFSPLARGFLRRTNQETIHFTAEASITELLNQTIHSANRVKSLVWSPMKSLRKR